MQARFRPHVKHSRDYYRALIKCVVVCLQMRLTYREIAAALQRQRLPSPVGSEWTVSAIAGLLHRLKLRTGHVWTSATELFYDGDLTRDDVKTLTRAIV